MRPKDPWKYVELHNLTMSVEIDGKKCYYCTKCKCRATRRVGFYQLSHTDATHDPNWKPEGNLTPIKNPYPTPLPLPTPTIDNLDLHDELVFTSINCAPVVLHHTPGDERENIDIDLGGRERRSRDGSSTYTRHTHHTVDLSNQYRQNGLDQAKVTG